MQADTFQQLHKVLRALAQKVLSLESELEEEEKNTVN